MTDEQLAAMQRLSGPDEPPQLDTTIKRHADFEQLLDEIRMMTAPSNEDMERLRAALAPEVNSDWVEKPGTWAYYAICNGRTIDELIAMANETYGQGEWNQK